MRQGLSESCDIIRNSCVRTHVWYCSACDRALGAQAAAAAEAEARNPVLRLRKLVAAQGGAGAAEAVRSLDVEGGLVGRMRALYEVRTPHFEVLG